ncbi:MAG: hypothetical protein ACAH95_07820 [Fimbriimonas sp.]
MDRAFTFADQRIIDVLTKDFIPAVGNTHELQNQKSPAGNWFMTSARTVNPRVLDNITAQGFYVVAADGRAYGFNNNRDPERVLGYIRKGEADFKAAPPSPVTIADADLTAAFTRKASEPVSTLRVFARIKPLPKDCDVLNHSVGRDHVWIYPSDLIQITGKTGKFPMPAAMANRLTRYHLVDNVRGEPVFWTASEVKKAEFQMWPKGPGTYAFSGSYAMATKDNARGLRGTLEGELKISTGTLSRFRAYGEAKAWGAGPYTPRPPAGEFPLVFAFIDVNDEFAKVTPPQAAAYGDGEYRIPNG